MCPPGQDEGEETQASDRDDQDRLSVIEEDNDAVPSGDMHHPILGMKSPHRGLSVQGSLLMHALKAWYHMTGYHP